MHVTHLKSNLNSPNALPYEFQLSRLVLVYGDNEAGKSSCVSTPLRLALTGTTDDVAGRDDVKDPQLLAQHAPVDGTCTLAALATFDEGSEASWGAVVEANGTVKRPVHSPGPVDPTSVLPLRDIRAVLRGDVKTARRTFLQWVGQATTKEDILAALPSHVHAKYQDIAEKQSGSATDRLVATAEYAAARVRSIEADAKAQDALVDGMSSGPQAAPSKEEAEKERALVQQWTAALERASAWESRGAADVGVLQQQRVQLFYQVEEAQGALAAWEAQVAACGSAPAAPVAGDPTAGTIADILDAAAPSGVCPVYGDNRGTEMLAAWARYHRGRAQVDPAALQAHEEAVRAWRARLTPAVQARDGWSAEVARRQRALAEADGSLAGLSSLPGGEAPVDPGVTVQQAREGLDAARARLAAVERRQSAWDTVRKARDAAAALRAEKPAYEDLRDRCNEAVKDLLNQQRESFQQKVQKYLPERWKFEIRLQDNGKETFSVGYRRADGRLHTLLSGGALDALEVALAMAVWDMGGGSAKKGKKGDGRYALVIPRDRQRSAATLAELMRAWSSFPGQVILESTVLPKGRTPAGWQVLDLDEWRKGLQAAAPSPWYYHPESDSYTRISAEEWGKLDPMSAGHLIEIEGLDEEAPARHRATRGAPPPPPPAVTPPVAPPPTSGGGNPPQVEQPLPPPPPPVQVEQPLPPPPPPAEEEVYDRVTLPPAAQPSPVEDVLVLQGLGYSAERLAMMGPKLRRVVASEKIAPENVMFLGQSFVVYEHGKPARSLPLGE